MKIFSLAMLVFFPLMIFSQNINKIDSLVLELKNAKHDTTKSYILYSLIEAENENGNLIWIKYNEQLLKLVKKNLSNSNVQLKIFFLKQYTIAINNLGYLAIDKGEISKALKYYFHSLKIQNILKDKIIMTTTLNNIGYIFEKQGNIKKALDYYYKSLKINEEIDDKVGIATDLNNIGHLYSNQLDNKTALKYFNLCLKISKEIRNETLIAGSLNSIASIYIDEKDFNQSLNYCFKSYNIQKKNNDIRGLSSTTENIGVNYSWLGNKSKALKYFQMSLKLKVEINDQNGIINSLNNIALQLLNLGLLNKSINYAQRSLQIATKFGFMEEIRNCSKTLKQIYLKQNKFKNAFEMLQLEVKMKDSISNIESRSESIRQSYNYQYDKKVLSDSLAFATKQSIANTKLSSEKNQKLFYGSLALLALAGVGFTFYQYKQKRKTNLQLTEINDKINKQNNTLKTLNTELIVSEENLYKSNNSKDQLINMMSHDLLNPITAITNYNQQIISRKNNTEQLLEAFKTVDAAIQPMHSLLDNMLQWTAIQKEGIKAKLKTQDINDIVKEIISIYRPQAQLKFITIKDQLQNEFLKETDKSILSLILRNLINNAIKYSANETTITVSSNADKKMIIIQDEGYGMTDEMINNLNNKQFNKIESKGSGLGLKLCYEFAEAVNANLHFNTNEGEGINVEIRL